MNELVIVVMFVILVSATLGAAVLIDMYRRSRSEGADASTGVAVGRDGRDRDHDEGSDGGDGGGGDGGGGGD